jgi:glutathione peroxidase
MNIYEIPVKDIEGRTRTLAEHRDRVLLIVNVASKCGFTPQYEGLEALYRKHGAQGLTILGFPCDQFLHQEPGTEAEIKSFCSTQYKVSFPLFAKIHVNGADAHPLYQHLKAERPGLLGTQAIKWNFTKFLIARDGKVAKRYGPTVTPAQIESDLVALLGA